MSCNSCSKSFSLLRPEKGCPACGFSYCSKCLNYKIFLTKLNSQAKVCGKCKNSVKDNKDKYAQPPDIYYKRLLGTGLANNENSPDDEIQQRLQKLKEEKTEAEEQHSDKDIAKRLEKLKDMPSTSQAELEQRLANIKGVPLETIKNKPITLQTDLRSEQEQANDLLHQFVTQSNIDKKYKDEFENKISDIEARLQKLRGLDSSNITVPEHAVSIDDSDDESVLKNIIEKVKSEIMLEDNTIDAANKDELPFCEICNEDAVLRCLGCKYLFCKRCFKEHEDEDDGCDKYEKYTAPKEYN